MDKRWSILVVFLVSCGRAGDGQESGESKREYSVLQALEASHRDTKIKGVEITESDDHRIVSLMAHDGATRLWIMLDPKSPPFYKQIPADLNFDLSETDLEAIRTTGKPISSTYESLSSHLIEKKEAEQDGAGQPPAAPQSKVHPR